MGPLGTTYLALLPPIVNYVTTLYPQLAFQQQPHLLRVTTSPSHLKTPLTASYLGPLFLPKSLRSPTTNLTRNPLLLVYKAPGRSPLQPRQHL